MRTRILLSVCIIAFNLNAQENLIQYVNPMVGTQRMGHTYPGATVPFGMVQLRPETDSVQYDLGKSYNKNVYAYCAGYQYDDPTIVGFAHTHFSGTGHSDLGDFLIMPTEGKLQLNPGTANHPAGGYRSNYSHSHEKAEPAYYRVNLTDYNILAELTTSSRVGFHQYTFPQTDSANIILDLSSGIYNHTEKNVWTFLRVENDTLITGYRQTNGWARTRTVYFAMTFNKRIEKYGHHKKDQGPYKGFYRKFNESENFPEMAGQDIVAWFGFKTQDQEKIKIKFALSSVSTEGALQNLFDEIPHWNFEQTKKEGQAFWNRELERIKVETISPDDKKIFYTAMYHSFLSPIIYMDTDRQYRGLDQNTHVAKDFTNYTIFSLWDTYRALHPLFNLIQTKRNSDMVESMLAHYDQSVHPMLPVWSHYANENWCMIGYHSVSVIADAIVKGVYTKNMESALEACVNTASYAPYDGLGYYMDYGYVPEDKNSSSVSKTLEYAYDDWAIAQIAQRTGNSKLTNEFLKRSESFLELFDSKSGFMRPKLANGNFKKSFDPMDTHGQGYIEGNAWNYGLYVPHQPAKLIELMGGQSRFVQMLDSLFTMRLDDKYIEATEDITRDGIIGNYVHGNEPGHHIPYLYNWTDKAWKTQERVRMICKTMYADAPDGLCGNDDCGQMSAWYIFSALGFYPVCPGSLEYAVGSPSVIAATIKMENGKSLIIKTKNQSDKNVYVKKLLFNNKEIKNNKLNHNELAQGGELVFIMSPKHSRK